MKRYFLYKILPKVLYILIPLFFMIIILNKHKETHEPTYSFTNVLAWMLTPPN
jgi:hypothetical protein